MKLKTAEVNGKQYAEIDASGLPVYVHDDGQEVGFDAVQAVGKISALNGEAKSHREAKEAAEANLAKFAKIGDPAKALEALDMMTKIDQKKLIDAGAVDQVKADITKSFQSQLDEANQRGDKLESQLYQEMIGGRFSGSNSSQIKWLSRPTCSRRALVSPSKWRMAKSLPMTAPATKFIPALNRANWRPLMRRWSSWWNSTLRKITS